MKSSKVLRTGIAGAAALAIMAISAPVSMAAPTGAAWDVNVGPMNSTGIMAMSFFPSVITIDAGDTVAFSGMGHTVTFPGSDGKLPAATSPQAQQPAGSSSYDGSTLTSSGMMMGKPYTLSFTKPGVYPYYCLLHPGMMGVVIVNPAGTAYPTTQAQYNAQAQTETQADFAAGTTAVNSFHVKSVKNSNGTRTYYAQTDAPESQAQAFNLTSANGSSVNGSALIAFAQPPSSAQDPNITYSVSAKLTGLTAGQSYTAVLSEGKSGSGVAVPNSQFDPVTVNSDGSGTVTGSVKAGGLPQRIWNLDVYDAAHNVVATGIIDHPSFAYERFLPATLKIHVGDTVVWKQTGVNEVHTVTFLPKGWKDIQNESQMPIPSGGHVFSGPNNTLYNSGFMVQVRPTS